MHKIVTIAALLTFVFTSCKQEQNDASGERPPQAVPVDEIAKSNISLHKIYPASIEGQEIVEIRPRIQGYIQEIYVDEGERVKKGQLLFKVNADNFEQQVVSAKATVKVAEAAVNSAEIEVARMKPLVEKELVGEYELTKAQFNLASAKASLAEAKANVKNAQTNIDFSRITAPSNGVIGTILFKKGSLVNPTISQPITILANNDAVRVYFSVNEKDYLDLKSGFENDSTKQVNLIMANGKTYNHKGHLDAVSGLIDKSTGALTIRASFPNPNLLLRSGGSGQIKITENLENVITIPQAATFEVQNKRFVYCVKEDNTIQSVEIIVVPADDGKSFVVENGLEVGDQIVVSGINGLKSGMVITPQK